MANRVCAVTVVTLLPLWDIKSRTPEVDGNLFTSLPSFIIPVFALEQTSTLCPSTEPDISASISAQGMRRVAPYSTDPSQISQFDPVGPLHSVRAAAMLTLSPGAAASSLGRHSSDRRQWPSLFSSSKVHKRKL
jgi:hypothetical protein